LVRSELQNFPPISLFLLIFFGNISEAQHALAHLGMLGWQLRMDFFMGEILISAFGKNHELQLDLDALRNYVDKTPLEYMQIRFRRGFDEETPIVPWESNKHF